MSAFYNNRDQESQKKWKSFQKGRFTNRFISNSFRFLKILCQDGRLYSQFSKQFDGRLLLSTDIVSTLILVIKLDFANHIHSFMYWVNTVVIFAPQFWGMRIVLTDIIMNLVIIFGDRCAGQYCDHLCLNFEVWR